MRIGYPCINRPVGCTAFRTFRNQSDAEQGIWAKGTGFSRIARSSGRVEW